VTKEEFYEALAIVFENLRNEFNQFMEAAKEFWEKLKEISADFLHLPEIQQDRQLRYREAFSKALKAHKKGNPLYLCHQVIIRKPRRCVARNSI
jgi:hypothetical protein